MPPTMAAMMMALCEFAVLNLFGRLLIVSEQRSASTVLPRVETRTSVYARVGRSSQRRCCVGLDVDDPA